MDTSEFRFQVHRAWRQSRTRLPLRAQLLERRAKQLLAIRLVGRTVRSHQHQRLARAKSVLVDTLQQRVLVVLCKLRECVRKRRPDRAAREMRLARWRQLRSKRDPARNPFRLVTQQPRHLPGRTTILLHQRADHPRFVQRRRGTRRRIGRQQQPLVLRDRRGGLHHHRHLHGSSRPPMR